MSTDDTTAAAAVVRAAGRLFGSDREGIVDTVIEISGERSFYDRFKECMSASGLPAPDSLFSTFAAALATARAIQLGVTTYGTSVTIAELIGAGAVSDALVVAGAALAASSARASRTPNSIPPGSTTRPPSPSSGPRGLHTR